MQVKVCIFYSVQSCLWTCCVHGNSTGLRVTLLWIKMGGVYFGLAQGVV